MMSRLAILPGLLCDERMFATQLARFPGSMAVGGFYAGCATITEMAEYALARIPGRTVLLGHSMGARVALEVLRLAPERIDGLVIADAGVDPVKPGESEPRHRLLDLGRADGMAALVKAWLPPMVAPANRTAEVMQPLTDMCVSAGLDTYAREIGALLSRPDAEAMLPGIACPTLIVVGAEDTWSPVSQHDAIAKKVPGAELRVIDGAGHMMPAEASATFNACLADWMARHSLAVVE